MRVVVIYNFYALIFCKILNHHSLLIYRNQERIYIYILILVSDLLISARIVTTTAQPRIVEIF